MSTLPLDTRCSATRQWLQAVLRERLNDGLTLERDDPAGAWVLRWAGRPGCVTVGDASWPTHAPMGDAPCAQWQARSEGWTSTSADALPAPGAGGGAGPWIDRTEHGWRLRYDVLDLAYHMLSRSEEVGHGSLDRHGRFPARASHAFRHGYLQRPVVDEWLFVLAQVVRRQWPHMPLRVHTFATRPTHDVDFPSRYAMCSTRAYLRAVGIDVLRRGRYTDALRSPLIRWSSRRRIHPHDPANTFEWLMETSERHGLRSAFYFICGRTDPSLDGGYEVEASAIADLMRRIHARGHEIGLHPSYGTYLRPDLLEDEARRLRSACRSLGIESREWGGRMHFLRWSMPETPRAWARAGMTYESTLTYADQAGFRAGTCFEYPAFDPVAREPIALRMRPLVAMECTVMDDAYMGLGNGAAAFDAFVALKRVCRAVGGTFTLLWHNTELDTPELRDLYGSVLAA